MTEAPATRPSLLVRLRDAGDQDAWAQFVAVYAPLIYGFVRKRGLGEPDAADLTQEVLAAVARNAGRFVYDRRRGTFRGWLFTIVRNKLHSFLSDRSRRIRATGDSAVQEALLQHAAPDELAASWDRAHETRLLAWACTQVRQATQAPVWQAFWQTAVEGRTPRAVAAELQMTEANVRLAKSRVMARLKEQVRQFELGGDEWHVSEEDGP